MTSQSPGKILRCSTRANSDAFEIVERLHATISTPRGTVLGLIFSFPGNLVLQLGESRRVNDLPGYRRSFRIHEIAYSRSVLRTVRKKIWAARVSIKVPSSSDTWKIKRERGERGERGGAGRRRKKRVPWFSSSLVRRTFNLIGLMGEERGGGGESKMENAARGPRL